jgi:hypothetical protein
MNEQEILECMSEEERANYVRASTAYEAILEDNITRLISELSEKDRAAFRDQGQKTDHDIRAFFKTVNHLDSAQEKSKSVLFKRLLDGHLPLAIAPPVSWAYPWYDVIEGAGPWPVSISRRIESIDEIMCQGLDFNTARRFNGIQINQSNWTLLERQSDTRALVSYKKWLDLGYTWLLERHVVEASNSKSPIVSVHNSRFSGRVRTLDDLKLEELGKAEIYFDKLKWGLDLDAAKAHVSEQRRISMLSERTAIADVREGQRMLVTRRAKGLPETPSRDEVEAKALDGLARVLDDGYFAGDDGVLMTFEWVLAAVTKGNPA